MVDRRTFVAGALAGGTATAANAQTKEVSTGTPRAANAANFGAVGDGSADDAPSIRKALEEADVVTLGPGRYRLGSSVRLRDGQFLQGAGASGWEPYTGQGPSQSSGRTELLVKGLAIDARDTTGVRIEGLAIRSQAGRQSEWGDGSGHVPGTIGIAIEGSHHFACTEVSFHALEVGVRCSRDQGRPAQMPSITDWVAEDCDAAIFFKSETDGFYCSRDVRIEGCIAAIHCNTIVEIKRCDGVRIENVRFFQCRDHSIVIQNSPFVSVTGATLFETGLDTMIMRRSQYITVSGTQVVRSGHFTRRQLVQRTAVTFDDCQDISFQGLVQQPLGRAFMVRDCTNVSLSGTVGTAFWRTGYLGGDDGAVRIERSRSVSINLAFGGLNYWLAIWSDRASAPSITGRIATEGTAGAVRAASLQSAPWGTISSIDQDLSIGAGKSVEIAALRPLVPSGQTVFSCCVEVTAPGVQAVIAGLPFEKVFEEPGGGTISTDRKGLFTNSGRSAEYAEISLALRNSTGKPISVPRGTELRVSLALGGAVDS